MIIPAHRTVDIMLIDIIAQMSWKTTYLTILLGTKLYLFMSYFYMEKKCYKDVKVFIIMCTVNAFIENGIKQIPGFKKKIKP